MLRIDGQEHFQNRQSSRYVSRSSPESLGEQEGQEGEELLVGGISGNARGDKDSCYLQSIWN